MESENEAEEFTSTPSFLKRKKEIKDVVKEIILPFLPAKTLTKFRSVSKEWDKWIRHPFLAHQQSYYFKDLSGFFCQYPHGGITFITLSNTTYGVPKPSLTFLPVLVDIISSCSGLLLCKGLDEFDLYYVCNPVNKEQNVVPPPKLYHGPESSAVLAFEPSVLNMGANYHIICAVPVSDVLFFELYSSKEESWSTSETIVVEMENSSFVGNGFYYNGVAYWETSTRQVLAYHLMSEIYEIISLPPETPNNGVLSQIQGELCYIGISNLLSNEYSIMIYTGMHLSLRRCANVNLGPESNSSLTYRILPCLDGNTVMILVGSFLYSYSMSDQRIEVVTRGGIDSAAANKYLAYVNSLVQVAKPSVSLS